MLTGESIALVTPRVTLFRGAVPDRTLPAMHEAIIRQAPPTPHILYGKTFAVGELAFPVDFPLVNVKQSLFEFNVVITMCDIDSTDSAVKPTRGNKIWVDLHLSSSSLRASLST